MKLVTFNRAMRGVGNPALLPDDIVAGLDPADIAKVEDRSPDKPVEVKPQTQASKPLRRRTGHLLGQTYLMK
jgi:hypothetical protein